MSVPLVSSEGKLVIEYYQWPQSRVEREGRINIGNRSLRLTVGSSDFADIDIVALKQKVSQS
jgi:hypothetical protein